MIHSGLLTLIVFSAASTAADAPVVLENDYLLVEFSSQDGSIIRLRNRQRDLDLISAVPESRRPWALLLAPFDLVSDFDEFRIAPDNGNPTRGVALEWQTPYDVTIKAEARLEPGSDELELTCAAENSGNRTIIAFRYPAVAAKNTTIRVPSVVSQAYTLGDDRLGILLVNLQSEAEQSVQLTVDPVSCGLPAGTYQLRQVTMDTQKDLDVFDNRHEIRVALPPREVVLLSAERRPDQSR